MFYVYFNLRYCYNSDMEKIKLGIDVDDCICNTLEMDFACAYHKYKKQGIIRDNVSKSFYDVTKSFCMEDGEEFFMKEKEYIMKNNSMYPKVFVKEVIKKLREKNFEIVFITSRLNKYWNGNAKLHLANWLEKHEIEYDKLYANITDKTQTCIDEKIDILIEDNADHVQNVNNVGIKSIIIKTDYNKNYSNPLNTFAENWLDLYMILGKEFNFDFNDLIEI